MHVTNLMIEKSLLGLLDTMAQDGVPIRGILMQAMAYSIIADLSNEITDFDEAYKLVEWYVKSLINIGGEG